MLLAGKMTARALDVRVFAADGEIGLAVIERLLVKAHQLCVAALVLGVAIAALLILDATMVALADANVCTDRFVAVHAQTGLRSAIEAPMTLRTVSFDLGMTANDRPRHECRFQALGVSVGIRNCHRAHRDENDRESGNANTCEQPPHGRWR
jgi:hypothetical protein